MWVGVLVLLLSLVQHFARGIANEAAINRLSIAYGMFKTIAFSRGRKSMNSALPGLPEAASSKFGARLQMRFSYRFYFIFSVCPVGAVNFLCCHSTYDNLYRGKEDPLIRCT